MTTISDVGLAPWLFNLYIDPKEEYPVGHRMNVFLASMVAELKGRDVQEIPSEEHWPWQVGRPESCAYSATA